MITSKIITVFFLLLGISNYNPKYQKKMSLYDIEIIDVPWGECPRNALDTEKDIDMTIRFLG